MEVGTVVVEIRAEAKQQNTTTTHVFRGCSPCERVRRELLLTQR